MSVRDTALQALLQSLKAQALGQGPGPNETTLRFYLLPNGRTLIIQFSDADGWNYYLPGQHMRLPDIEAELRGASLASAGQSPDSALVSRKEST